jgi:hypothetical protein
MIKIKDFSMAKLPGYLENIPLHKSVPEKKCGPATEDTARRTTAHFLLRFAFIPQ